MDDDPNFEVPDAPNGLFGLKSPGKFFAILIPVLLFAALFLAAWWSGAFDCHNFNACPELKR